MDVWRSDRSERRDGKLFFNEIQLNYALFGSSDERCRSTFEREREIGMLTCNISLGFDKLVEVWFDKGEPLLDAAFDVSTPFSDISNDYSELLVLSQVSASH